MKEIKFYAAIADIHGEFYKLNRALTDVKKYFGEKNIKRENWQIVFLGDYIDRGVYPTEVLELIKKETEAGAITLIGNHDYFLIGTGAGDPREALDWDVNNGMTTCHQLFGSNEPVLDLTQMSPLKEYMSARKYSSELIKAKSAYTTWCYKDVIRNSWQYKFLSENGRIDYQTKHIFFSHAPLFKVKEPLSFREHLWGQGDAYYEKPDTIFKVPNDKMFAVHGHFHRLWEGETFPRVHSYNHGGIRKTVVLADSGCGCSVNTGKFEGLRGELHPVILSENEFGARIETIL